MKMRNVTENVIEILRKIKWLKSEYSKKKLSKERRLKSLLKNEYFKVSLNEVSRDLRLRRSKIMDIRKRIGNYFEKNYQIGRKIIWKVLLKSMPIF